MAVQLQGSNAVAINADAASYAARAVLYDSAGNPIVQLPNAVIGATQKIIPIGGSVEGNWNDLRVDRLGNVRPGNDLLWLRDPVEGTTLNSEVWTAGVTGFGIAQSATTGIALNSAATFAASSIAILQSNKQLPLLDQTPLRVRIRARVVPQTNALFELGFGLPAGGTAQINNGCYWRWTAAGTLVPVLSYNSSDTVQGADTSALINSADYYTYEVTIVSLTEVVFAIYAGNLLLNSQTLTTPLSQPSLWGVTHNNLFARLYSTASAPPAAPLVFISAVLCQSFDLLTNKPWTHQLAGTGLSAEVNPTTFAQTANWTNSTAPTAASLSNTAAGYATLGGQFAFAAVAGAATDYALFGLQIPLPYAFLMTGVHISAWNSGAANATTATLLQWAAFGNSAAISLASTPPLMRVPLGAMYFAVGAAIGQCADKDLEILLDPPLHTVGGHYAGIILRIPVGTATAAQVIQGAVLIKGYFE